VTDLLANYDANRKHLEAAGKKVEDLIKSLLDAGGLRVHSVTHRVKERESLERKILKKKFTDLTQVHDMLGLRIISYLKEDVAQISALVEREFKVNEDHSMDKGAMLDPDRFGYLSVHYVAELAGQRAGMPEYRQYADVVFEIQIRSILQHAWAEIEHDLGYKAESEIPRDIRRRFSRLSGLLEIADDEFVVLKDEVNRHVAATRIEIDRGERNLPIDRDSLAAYIRSSKLLRQLDRELAGYVGASVEDEEELTVAGRTASQLKQVEFKNIGEVDEALKQGAAFIRAFSRRWMTDDFPDASRIEQVNFDSQSKIPHGLSLFYVFYVRFMELLADRGEAWGVEFLDKQSFLESSGSMIHQLRSCWAEAMKDLSE
jgi:putative GTP pyrophosphokinase